MGTVPIKEIPLIKGNTGCHWRWAWSDAGSTMYSAFKSEYDDSYMDALDPDYIKNLAFSLNIEFDQIVPQFQCVSP